MSIPSPNLDDTDFEQLVEEAKKKINVYSKTWTDYNVSDPGITLLELFAWLAEMQIYSINLISNKNHLKYLKLLGIKDLLPAISSTLDINFYRKELDINSYYIKKGTVIAASLQNKLVLFETDDDLYSIPTEIEKVMTYSNFKFTDVTESLDKNYFYPFGKTSDTIQGDNFFCIGLKDFDVNSLSTILEISSTEDETKTNELKIINSKTWFANPSDISLSISFYIYDDDLPPVGKHGEEQQSNFLQPTDRPISNDIFLRWEYMTIDNLGNSTWVNLDPLIYNINDSTKGFSKSGRVSFKIPFKNSDIGILPGFESESSTKMFWIRCKDYNQNTSIIAPRIKSIKVNTVSATQGITIENDMKRIGEQQIENYITNLTTTGKDTEIDNIRKNSHLYSDINSYQSNGLPKQRFAIDNKNFDNFKDVSLPMLNIQYIKTEEANSDNQVISQLWKNVNDFDSSGIFDSHYIVDKDEGIVYFGDGINGKIPSKGAKIKIKYKALGQQVIGNKKDNAWGTLVPAESSLYFFNEKKNGDDRSGINKLILKNFFQSTAAKKSETIKEAEIRANTELKIPYKAVSASDFEYITKQTPGLRIAKAKAFVPSSLPSTTFTNNNNNDQNENTVNIVVVPYSNTIKNAIPSDDLLYTVCKHIDIHRLITTKINVIPPTYVGISIIMSLTYQNNTDTAQLQQRIYKSLDDFLIQCKYMILDMMDGNLENQFSNQK